MSKNFAFALLFIIFGIFVANGLADQLVLQRMPSMIQATYLNIAVELVDQWTGVDRIDLSMYGDILTLRFYPPVYLILLALTFLLGGLSYLSVATLNIGLGLIALLALYQAGRLLADRPTGLLAALLFAAYPAIHKQCALGSIDYAFVCFAAVGFCLYVAWRHSRHIGWLVGWGLGVAVGMMTRWTFAVVVAALFLALLIELFLVEKDRRRKNIRPFLLFLAVSVLACLPLVWWIIAQNSLPLLLGASQDEIMLMPFFQTVAFYPRLMLTQGTGIVLGALAGLSFFALLIRRDRRAWPLLIWIAIGYVVFSFLPPKKLRYVLFLIPALALTTAYATHLFSRPRLRGLVIGLVALCCLLTLIGTYENAHPYDRQVLNELLDDIESDWSQEKTVTIMVHDRYYPPETDLNSITLAFHNATENRSPKAFIEGNQYADIVHKDICMEPLPRFDYMIFPFVNQELSPQKIESLPLFSCFDFHEISRYDLNPYNGETGQINLYQLTSLFTSHE